MSSSSFRSRLRAQFVSPSWISVARRCKSLDDLQDAERILEEARRDLVYVDAELTPADTEHYNQPLPRLFELNHII
jgi:hypothetical protein